MANPITFTHTFGGLSSPVPLSYLDDNFGNVSTAFSSLNTFGNYYVDNGAINAYNITLGAGEAATLAAGLPLQVKIANANTGASTLSINAGTAKAIQRGGAALTKDELQANLVYSLQFDGTEYQLLSIIPKSSTFTPVLAFGGASTGITYSTQSANYCKIANWVQGSISIILTNKGSSTGAVGVTGLPYTASGGNDYPVDIWATGLAAGVTTSMMGTIQNTATSVLLYKFAAGSVTQLDDTAFANTSQLFIRFGYSVS